MHPLVPLGLGVLAFSAAFLLPGQYIMRHAEMMTCPTDWSGFSCSLDKGIGQGVGTTMVILGGIAGAAGLVMTIVGATRRSGEAKPKQSGLIYLH